MAGEEGMKRNTELLRLHFTGTKLHAGAGGGGEGGGERAAEPGASGARCERTRCKRGPVQEDSVQTEPGASGARRRRRPPRRPP